jgi:hypothetical protein
MHATVLGKHSHTGIEKEKAGKNGKREVKGVVLNYIG